MPKQLPRDVPYHAAITVRFKATDDDDAQRQLLEMVGAMKTITPEDFRLEVDGGWMRDRPGGPIHRLRDN